MARNKHVILKKFMVKILWYGKNLHCCRIHIMAELTIKWLQEQFSIFTFLYVFVLSQVN